jgi:hypothetical protein
LPPELADVLEPAVPEISGEIVRAIGEEVPEYVRPFEGAFGRGVRAGVGQALERFVAQVRDPDAETASMRRVNVALGRDELRAGRTLDALQAAYRVGARVAWRRIAEIGAAAGYDQATLARLAEAIFAYIDGLSAESVEGYAAAQFELAGEHERRGRELVEALLEPSTPTDVVDARSAQAGWSLPRTAAAIACLPDHVAGLARRIGADVLATRVDGLGCIVVPDAGAPGRREAIRLASGERPSAMGPNGPLDRLRQSWQLARETLALSQDKPGLVVAEDHLADLLLVEAATVVERIAERRLGAFDALTPKARARMAATALAYVQHGGSAPAMARALHVHPQTARYRMERLRELLGDQLDDPDARFELEAALRARDAALSATQA